MSGARRTISIAASSFNLPYTINVCEMGPPMDGLFEDLYRAYLINERFWPRFAVKKSSIWNTFVAASKQYFDENLRSAGTKPFLHVEQYFENFSGLWQLMYRRGMLEYAERLWEIALEPVLEWEMNHPDKRIHKGTPYYFWAMTALLRGDTDRGFLIAHQALEEDVLSTGCTTPDLPAHALVSLNHQKTDQAMNPWVNEHADFLDSFIANYVATYNRSLTIDDVKRRFMDKAEVDTLFLFTHTLARLRTIAKVPDHVVQNSFAAQLQINLLFDLTLVIDSAIKVKKPAKYFGQLTENLLSAAQHPVKLGDVAQKFEADFDRTLSAALDASLVLRPGHPLDRLQCDAAAAYGLRNRAAHQVATSAAIQMRFHDVEQAIFRVLCATIDYLY